MKATKQSKSITRAENGIAKSNTQLQATEWERNAIKVIYLTIVVQL